jgi:hypothetical protein
MILKTSYVLSLKRRISSLNKNTKFSNWLLGHLKTLQGSEGECEMQTEVADCDG